METRTFREIWEPLVHTNFSGNLYGPIPWCLAFRENLYGPSESSSKVSTETGIGPWMALLRTDGTDFRDDALDSLLSSPWKADLQASNLAIWLA